MEGHASGHLKNQQLESVQTSQSTTDLPTGSHSCLGAEQCPNPVHEYHLGTLVVVPEKHHLKRIDSRVAEEQAVEQSDVFLSTFYRWLPCEIQWKIYEMYLERNVDRWKMTAAG